MVATLSFQSAEQRRYVWLAFLSLIPNALIACVVTYFGDPQDRVFTFVAVMVCIWLLEAAFWLRNVIWSWLVFKLYGERSQSDALLAYLKANKFPRPVGHYSTAEDYFLEIANDTAAPVEVRMKALALAVRRRSYGEMGKVTLSIQNAIAAEHAVRRYAQTFGSG